MSFSDKILSWYSKNKRSLPWRETTNPYHIWLSEIILQQTRVAQGTPYYLRFVARFPTVQDLAAASEEEVLKLWQGLGYYSRARNLHAAANMVVKDYQGVFPNTYKELLKLKGVGDYTASAVSSISFNEPHAVVDGNVYRVLARYFGVDTPINSSEGIRYFKKLAQTLIQPNHIRDYNQGIMEFGAIQCKPQNPNCGECPLQESCLALQYKMVDQLPVKLKKTKVKARYFNYVVPLLQLPHKTSFTKLHKRHGKGIWQNLWEFPLIESKGHLTEEEILQQSKSLFKMARVMAISLFNEQPIVHKLSHQHLHTRFWIVHIEGYLEDKISVATLQEYPVPVLMSEFIKAFKF